VSGETDIRREESNCGRFALVPNLGDMWRVQGTYWLKTKQGEKKKHKKEARGRIIGAYSRWALVTPADRPLSVDFLKVGTRERYASECVTSLKERGISQLYPRKSISIARLSGLSREASDERGRQKKSIEDRDGLTEDPQKSRYPPPATFRGVERRNWRRDFKVTALYNRTYHRGA